MFMVLCFMFFEYECRKVDMIAYWQAHGIRSTLARVWFCRDIAIMPYVICKLCTHICDMHPLLWTPTSTHWRTRTDNHCAVTLCKIKQSNILWHVRIKFFQPQKHDFTSSMFFLHNIYTYIYILYIDIHPIYIIYIYIFLTINKLWVFLFPTKKTQNQETREVVRNDAGDCHDFNSGDLKVAKAKVDLPGPTPVTRWTL